VQVKKWWSRGCLSESAIKVELQQRELAARSDCSGSRVEGLQPEKHRGRLFGTCLALNGDEISSRCSESDSMTGLSQSQLGRPGISTLDKGCRIADQVATLFRSLSPMVGLASLLAQIGE